MDANEKETHPSSGSTLTPSPPSSTTPSLNIPHHHHSDQDPDPEKVSTSSTTDDKAAAVGLFEPIRAAPGTANDNNNVSSARRRLSVDTVSTLRRERSNNGWGVDDIEDSAADADAVAAPYNSHHGPASGAADADPFEVGWDGGDADPLCPRSFPAWRKWLIIAVTSVGSFCV